MRTAKSVPYMEWSLFLSETTKKAETKEEHDKSQTEIENFIQYVHLVVVLMLTELRILLFK